MKRRGFLKLMGALGASAAVCVPEFALANPMEAVIGKPVQIGLIRALGYYDILTDLYLVRLDAFNGKDQIAVDFKVENGAGGHQGSYLFNRTLAEQVLRDSIKYEGWRVSEMQLLPTPAGYVAPEWMQ